jgi:methylenetetrahydrofolate reductase (NADPH)
VYPGKKRCIYVRAYERLRAYREEESMKDGYIPPRDWDLAGTSSWANYFLGRDHQGMKPSPPSSKVTSHPETGKDRSS